MSVCYDPVGGSHKRALRAMGWTIVVGGAACFVEIACFTAYLLWRFA